jgi:hypothetical protein
MQKKQWQIAYPDVQPKEKMTRNLINPGPQDGYVKSIHPKSQMLVEFLSLSTFF